VYAPGKFKHAYEMVADAKDEARRAEKEVGGLTSSHYCCSLTVNK
jgi:hypothetical protein